MVIMKPSFLTADQQTRLIQLGNTGQMELMYTTNPTGRRGQDRHVVIVRDEAGHVTQDDKLTTAEFKALVTGTVPCEPAPATLPGFATYTQVCRTGQLLEHFDPVALDLRSTPPRGGIYLDTWDRRRERFVRQWEILDSAARREWLAEARAVLFEFHAYDAEREASIVPTLAELHEREIRTTTGITVSVQA